ncbi:hypothetical protein P5673_022661 [Acropora cervicornis]|uniref:Uncharacterized protein n=1 Tax=Acropora cervicornis TaxID=6130 RepID=A0AAD9Q6H3_ACRCE|nr:hypothetical protein P5673_022661 [Acropora cervicornis]
MAANLCNCNDDDEENLQWLFAVWPAYVWIALIPLIGIIFGGNDPIENKLDSQVFLGPNVLKMTYVYLRPLLLLLLLSIGTDSMSYRDLIWLLSLRIALNLFDTVEMLELMQIKLLYRGEWEYRDIASICHKTLQTLVVNCLFLGLRLGLFLEYGKDASIFIAKNGIVILLSLLQICSEFIDQGFYHAELSHSRLRNDEIRWLSEDLSEKG